MKFTKSRGAKLSLMVATAETVEGANASDGSWLKRTTSSLRRWERPSRGRCACALAEAPLVAAGESPSARDASSRRTS